MANLAPVLGVLRQQIAWTRLISICEEQARTLIRTSFSATVREAEDLSAGIFDLQGRMVAQAVTGTPGHVNSMANAVPAFLAMYPPETMQPGDCLVTNDPWITSGHLHDYTSVTPVFRNGRVIALFSSTIHVVDVGGIGLSADGKQVFEEGVRIPILRLFRGGVINDDVARIIGENCRTPLETLGDLYSMAAAGEDGARRLLAMLDELSLPDIDELSRYIIDTSLNAVKARIASLPHGVWDYVLTSDGYDEPIVARGRLSVTEDEIHLDLAGSSKPSGFGINVVMNYTIAYASYGLRCAVAPDIPNNFGSLSPMRITAPPDTIFNALSPAPVAARHVVGHMLPDLVLGCLRQAIPHRVPAESHLMWNPQYRSVTANGSGRDWQIYTFNNGGTGARPGKDGLSATTFPAGVKNIPVEVVETIVPLVMWKKELRPDSGGAGRFRGGLGQSIEVGHRNEEAFAVSAMFDRIVHPARGVMGGGAGAAGQVWLRSGEAMRSKGVQVVPRGDRLCMELPGGGGLGDPRERPRESVQRDVQLGYVSSEAAATLYGAAP